MPLSLFINFFLPISLLRLESDHIRGRNSDPRRRRSHDPANGATVPYSNLHLLLRPRRRLRGRHELRRQLGALGFLHVRQKRLQAPLPTEGKNYVQEVDSDFQ